MSDIICKYLDLDDSDKYIYLSQDNGALIKDNTEYAYFAEYDIVKRIKENADGYFDFSKNLIDIGSCYGAYSMLLDFNHNYAFEGNKRKCCLIYANMWLRNKVDNTDVYCTLLSDKQESLDYNGFSCSDYCNYIEGTYSSTPTKILDGFQIDNVGFIKVDVEGMEEKVLRGGVGTIIRSNYPPILFECWPIGMNGMTQERHDTLYSFLRGLGYEILECWGQFDTHLAIHKTIK
jgi:FkbM family methyltransferase